MSTQSISLIDLNNVKNNLDKVFSCTSNKILLEAKLGLRQLKSSMSPNDTFLFNYLYDLINNDRNCYLIFDDECALEKVNKLLLKNK